MANKNAQIDDQIKAIKEEAAEKFGKNNELGGEKITYESAKMKALKEELEKIK